MKLIISVRCPYGPLTVLKTIELRAELDQRILPFTCIYNTEMSAEEAVDKLMDDVRQGGAGTENSSYHSEFGFKIRLHKKDFGSLGENGTAGYQPLR